MEIPDPFVVLQILMETLNETIDVRDEGNSFFKNPWRVLEFVLIRLLLTKEYRFFLPLFISHYHLSLLFY